jgi:hypothetical protein
VWAYWVHNGTRWVCTGTKRDECAMWAKIIREPGSYAVPRKERGRMAVTRATSAGRTQQLNYPTA